MLLFVYCFLPFIACQFVDVLALGSADECQSAPADLIHLDHATQHISSISMGSKVSVEGFMKSVESSHHFVVQVSLCMFP